MIVYNNLNGEYKNETNSGSGIVPSYGSRIDKKGNVEVYETGHQDLYSYIQSFKDSVDINVLIKKFENGDDSALYQVNSQYIDTTDIPTNFAEILNTVNNARSAFENLPSEERSKFDNSFEKYFIDLENKLTKPVVEKVTGKLESVADQLAALKNETISSNTEVNTNE